MSEWKEDFLDNHIKVKHGFAFKGEFISESQNENILVTPGNFKIGGGFKSDKLKYYHGNVPPEYILRPNDVIVTMTDLSKEGDTLGYSAKVPSDSGAQYLHNQRIGLITLTSEELDIEYLYWLMRTRDYQKSIVSTSTGSTVRHTSPSRIGEYHFKFPQKEEQKQIAKTLSDLDKKNTLLRQQNQTLEELAQTLFKRWFVEFEFPDKNGRPYKSSGGKMVESELGEIPEGWRVGAIKDFGKIVCGKTPSKQNSSFYGNDVPFLKIPDMHGTVYPLKTVDNLSNEGSNSQINKLIPAKSIIVSCIATVGLVCINPYDCHTNQQINSVVLEEEHSRYYLFHCLKGMKSVLENIGSGGSATLNVNTSVFSNIEILVPSSEIIMKHYNIINPFFEKLLTNQKEIQTLTQLRDTLLPKLMSGEVRVKSV